jgi:NAD(P)H-dependent flavin oxidoreductase YrpB (nitropropane dioxygenase family)
MSDTPSDSGGGSARARADDGAAGAAHPALHTRFCDLVGCRLPIVQTGMGWVSGASLTAATSAAGGLGVLAAVTMTPDQFADAVRAVKDRTDAPFGANFRADQPDLDDRIDLCMREGIRLVSFAGAPTKDAIGRLHDAGILVMPTVGARRHAEKMLGWGVDAVIAQGGEGGGHTGTVPTSLLLPDVVDAVGHAIPVLGAGGFHDGRGLVAALAWGADGVAMGTRFLLTAESPVPRATLERYLAASVTDTKVTTAIDGLPHRVVVNEMLRRLEAGNAVSRLVRALRSGLAYRKMTGASIPTLLRAAFAMQKNDRLTRTQALMAANSPILIRRAMVEGHPSEGVLPSGQVTGVIDDLPTCADLIARIIAEAERRLDILTKRGIAIAS